MGTIVQDQNEVMTTIIANRLTGQVFYAMVGCDFVDMLLTFLAIPLGLFVHITKYAAISSCLNNLHESASSIGEKTEPKSSSLVKDCLVQPKFDVSYRRVTTLLPIYGPAPPALGSFFAKSDSFVVYDDLRVEPMSEFGLMVEACKIHNLSFGDMESIKLPIREKEAKFILKTFLTSKSTLTECLKVFRKDLQTRGISI